MPDVAITTDIIVGFPGETDEMYRNGYELIRAVRLRISCFVFLLLVRLCAPPQHLELNLSRAKFTILPTGVMRTTTVWVQVHTDMWAAKIGRAHV